jgi:CRISPR-associated protein Csx10
MESDWHVGVGAGRPGDIDRLVARDADDLPYVPAKTLTGIWRDAVEKLAFALDEGKDGGKWAKWVDVIFGSQPALSAGIQTLPPRPASLMIGPARLSQPLRDRLTGDNNKPLRSSLTFVKPGVAIDARSGQAQPNYLRFEEMTRGGTRLYADCTLTMSDNYIHRAAVTALLLASAKLVERLGGKRRRGAGRCVLQIENADEKLALKWLSNTNDPPEPPPFFYKNNSLEGDSPAERNQSETSDDWVSIPITLNLQMPVSIAARTVGNVTETLDYIPGTYLLPHVTRALEKEFREAGLDFRAAVVAGEVQVLAATIDVKGARGLPVPYALSRRKVDGGFRRERTMLNRFLESEYDLPHNGEPPQIKDFREEYIGEYSFSADDKEPHGSESIGGTLPQGKTVSKILTTHNIVQDEAQRPSEDVVGVYSREAIDASTVLRTELRLFSHIADELSKQRANWWKQIEGPCRIGASSKDDYGAATVETSVSPIPLNHLPGLDRDNPDRLTVWLVSDVLLRGNTLRPEVSICALKGEIESRLSIKLTEARPEEGLLSSRLRAKRIESWQVSWGLPRPSLVALAAGSCAVFEVTEGSLNPAALRTLEASGIGERRGEGYGQVCFNPPLLTNKINNWEIPDEQDNTENPESEKQDLTDLQSKLSLSEEDIDYAQQVEVAAWRDALHRVVLGVAADADKRKEILGIELSTNRQGQIESKPPMSQLAGLRSALRNLKSDSDAGKKPFKDWLKQLIKTKNRAGKWPDGALETIESLIKNNGRVWQAMEVAWQHPPILTGRSVSELCSELWADAVRALVDACIRAHKRDLEKSEEQSQG